MSSDSTEFQRPITGSFTAVSQSVDITSPDQATEVVQIAGTWSGTLVVEGCNDGATYTPVIIINSATNLPVSSITANGKYFIQSNAHEFLQVRSSTWTSGTANLYSFGSDATSLVSSIDLIRGGTDGTIIGNKNDELATTDSVNHGGADAVLSLSTTPIQGMVGMSVMLNRKYIWMQGISVGANPNAYIFWGFNSTTQSFKLFKSQMLVFPIGSGTQIWFKAPSAIGTYSVAFGEGA